MSQTCAHCLRTAEYLGGSMSTREGGQVSLCHDDNHDCYTLVTNSLYGHVAGPCACSGQIVTPAQHFEAQRRGDPWVPLSRLGPVRWCGFRRGFLGFFGIRVGHTKDCPLAGFIHEWETYEREWRGAR